MQRASVSPGGDLSIGRLVSYPIPFSGDGPDLYVSVFGLFTHVTSAFKQVDPNTGHPWDGIDKRKSGPLPCSKDEAVAFAREYRKPFVVPDDV